MPRPYQPGRVVAGRYRLTSLLSQGGMGAIWRAEQLSLGREVAFKVLRAKFATRPDVLVRFEREARAVCDLSHPNLVTYYDYGRDEDGRPFLVMELIPGAPGTTLVKRVPPLGLSDIVHVVSQLARALSAAHAVGIVHRDVKWSNVMVTPVPGDPLFVKLIDFGVLTVADDGPEADRRRVQELTDLGDRIGTPRTMSPEQALGQPVDQRSDLYSLGLMTWELLAGRAPFMSKDPLEILRMQVEDPPPPLAEAGCPYNVPPLLERTVLRAMAKSPADRFPTVEDFRRALAISVADRRGRVEMATRRALHGPAADGEETAIEFRPNGPVEPRPRPVPTPRPATPPDPTPVLAAPSSRAPVPPTAVLPAVVPPTLAPSASAPPAAVPATLAPSASAPPAAVPPTSVPPASVTPFAIPAAPTPARPRARTGVLVGAAAVALGGLVLWAARPGDGPTAPDDAPTASLARPVAAPGAEAVREPEPEAEPEPVPPAVAEPVPPAEAEPVPPAEAEPSPQAEAAPPPEPEPEPAAAPEPEPEPEPEPAVAPPPTRPPSRPARSPGSDRAAPAARAEGFLTVSARPWARVAIDGQPVGTTPVVGRALAVGTHTVTLTHDTFGTRTRRVRLGPGERRHISVDMSRP